MAMSKKLRKSVDVVETSEADVEESASDEAAEQTGEAAPKTSEAADGATSDGASADDESAPEITTEVDEDNEADDDYDEDEYEETEDSLTYSNGVIEKIVAMATREVPHVLGMKGNLIHRVQESLGAKDLTKGVSVEVTDDNRVIVNISVIIEYGCYAPAIFEDVKTRVTERLDAMTGLEVAGVNLRIEDVVTLEAYNESKKQAADGDSPSDES